MCMIDKLVNTRREPCWMSPEPHRTPWHCFVVVRKCTKAQTPWEVFIKDTSAELSSQSMSLGRRGPHRMAHLPFSTHGLFFIRSGFRKGSLGIPSSIHLRSLWVGRLG